MSQATLEMVADMRWQFASMLADARFVVPPRGYSGAGSRDRSWTDDSKEPWNKQAHQPSMVSDLCNQFCTLANSAVCYCMRSHYGLVVYTHC